MLARSNKISSIIGGLIFALLAVGLAIVLWNRDSSSFLFVFPILIFCSGVMLLVWTLNGSMDLKVDQEGIRLFNMNFPWEIITSAEIFRHSLEGHDQSRFMTINFNSPVKFSKFQQLKSKYENYTVGKNTSLTVTNQISETDISDSELNSVIEQYLANKAQ